VAAKAGEETAMSARNADRARDTRERIIEAAATAFAQRGFAGTSLNQMLRDSGISKGALYFHFPSKEALAIAVIDHLRSAWLEATLAGVDGPSRGSHRLQLMARASTAAYHDVSGYRALGKLCWELLALRPDLGPELRATFGMWTDAIEAVLRQAQEAGDLRRDIDVRGLAELSSAAFIGMQELSELMTGGADLDARVDCFLGLMELSLVKERG
jgi:AcrR family transcriptional regulator